MSNDYRNFLAVISIYYREISLFSNTEKIAIISAYYRDFVLSFREAARDTIKIVSRSFHGLLQKRLAKT